MKSDYYEISDKLMPHFLNYKPQLISQNLKDVAYKKACHTNEFFCLTDINQHYHL